MHDPMFIRANLAVALDHPALSDDSDTPAKREASWTVAVALGKARLFAASLDELEGVLPYSLALAAIAHFNERFPEWDEQTEQLDTTWDEITHPEEADHLLISTLRDRLDAWAAWVAIEELRQRNPTLIPTLDEIELRLESWDDGLNVHSDLIATLSEATLVLGWRNALVEPYRSDAPWWLTDEIDRIAHRSMETAVATMPNSDFWGVVQRRAMLPDFVPGPVLAASTEGATPKVRTMTWVHPDRTWRARLDYPDPSNDAEEDRPRRLHFHPLTDTPLPASLIGMSVRLGANESLIGDDRWAAVNLRQLRADPLLQLFVAETAWELVLKKDPP